MVSDGMLIFDLVDLIIAILRGQRGAAAPVPVPAPVS
ncbi:MAG: hypothetical protein UY21_C0007G0010 [Microgenomates group bacterium GW2011_GWA1_48_10]|nr:MAG: hypothetical protein UY21_C0007G0010 [Microgenomates group bacterium GW2011_GWA1_48_10]